MVCVEIHLIVTLPPSEMCVCVYVGLGAMFLLSNKLKDAEMSGEDWRKKERQNSENDW